MLKHTILAAALLLVPSAAALQAQTVLPEANPEGKLLTDKPQYYEDWQKKYGVIE